MPLADRGHCPGRDGWGLTDMHAKAERGQGEKAGSQEEGAVGAQLEGSQ